MAMLSGSREGYSTLAVLLVVELLYTEVSFTPSGKNTQLKGFRHDTILRHPLTLYRQVVRDSAFGEAASGTCRWPGGLLRG